MRNKDIQNAKILPGANKNVKNELKMQNPAEN